MVTIFTPVYNRRILMDRLYKSLLLQSDNNFEWIIVDDGSTDHLNEQVANWIQETNSFNIKYVYTKNGGKHRAINLGVKLSSTEAFMIVDSDDYLTNDAISFINREFTSIANDDNFAGISGLKAFYSTKKIMGGIPNYEGYVDATNLERNLYNLLGDKAEIYKTSVLKKYPFPEFKEENFCAETIVWDQIAFDGYKIRWFTKIIYMAEYISDGLTRNLFEVYRNSPRGWAMNLQLHCKWEKWNEREKFNSYFSFFEREHTRLSKMEICELLQIDDMYYKKMLDAKKNISKKISQIITRNRIRSLALYGMGVYAKRLLLYLEELNIKVAYTIDRDYQYINYHPIYSPDDDLDIVDSICITFLGETKPVEEMLIAKFPNSYIWKFTDILEEILNN